MRAKPHLLGLVAFALTSAAALSRADDSAPEGMACVTTADCGSLHCVSGACRDLRPSAEHRELPTPQSSVPLGHQMMFGTGTGYVTEIAIVDVMVALSEPALAVASMSQLSSNTGVGTTLGVIAFALPALPSAITHFAHGRVVPGIISFFAWPSLAATTFVVGGIFGLAFETGFEFNTAAAWAGGIVFGALGAVGFTFLDMRMARPMSAPQLDPNAPRFSASVVPTRGGGIASFGASW